jgi:hypothetical protein
VVDTPVKPRRHRGASAAVRDILFGQQEAGGLALQPPYFLASAATDGQGTPIGPGFTFFAPILRR